VPSRISNTEEVAAACAALGVDATALDSVTVEAGGHRFRVAAAAHPTPAEASELCGSADFLIADRLSTAARERLNAAGIGWLDRRGHLRIRVPGLIVDTDLPATAQRPVRGSGRLGETGLDIVVTLLGEPERTWGVNELARYLGRSPGRISEILGALRDQGLVTPAATPLVPELFWAAADAWKPRWMPLSGVPEGPDAARLSGGRAAAALGAGLVLTPDWPLELYIADAWSLRNLAAEPPSGRVRAVGARCPSPAALQLPAAGQRSGFLLAHPVVIALDLAQDRARGREILQGWSPPKYARVW
jgi:hypothetical protein